MRWWQGGGAAALLEELAAARGRFLLWAPVLFSLGIGAYFALPVEPGGAAAMAIGAVLSGAFLLRLRGPERWHVPALVLLLVLAGLLAAMAHAHLVAAPVLAERYYGPVTGRIVGIDRSFSDQLRLTLDAVTLQVVAPSRTPERVRIALHGAENILPEPGQRVRLTAHLSPPDGPVEPGGFDFQRVAWFSGLGAVGYTRDPVEVLTEAAPGPDIWAFRARMTLSRAMQGRMEGQAGAFAAALMTGDRSGVTRETTEALRASNLSHLISISGLHMGLLTGFVFALCRYGLALVPPLALRLNTKKVAAVVALLAAAFYLFLAGPNVATRRAFVMAAVMLCAVLVDRRAISLRSVAIAALLVLTLAPESLVEPGFQMSFGATVALIVAFEHWGGVAARLPAVLRPVAGLCLSSLSAGLATAPIAGAHFNRIAEYGFAANLAAVPLMGLAVMPAGVLAALLAPLGLAAPALWVMEAGCRAILAVAGWITALDGAVIPVPAPASAVLPLMSLGALILALTRRRGLQLAGAAAVVAGIALWSSADRPALLVAAEGKLVGVMTEGGRALSKPLGAGFVASSWLEDDGDGADQETAFGRGAFTGPRGQVAAGFGPRRLWHLTGKTGMRRAGELCRSDTIVVLDGYWHGGRPDCLLFDAQSLARSGALAISMEGGDLRITAARDISGRRLWNDRVLRAWRLGN
ncbi:ComEC/Rec2 family competence protein [Defluviimonas sp. WL0075]|uniref:ComEC family competence protein n=1 Tax=Albidovulum sediminicola TaxID=2984331 RepID=A0ABT2Z0M1_9RHOB|nr:ComEC/Rec2 family competence protein [Defluviimonas sp. WL0075]MCV2864671.1 ComEC family competence protein [Defluviimonas sp. WL0075]